jgi:hypothetical protein
MLKLMLLGACITAQVLWMLYLIDEERFRGAQAHAERVWNTTVAALPPQIVEMGQMFKDMTKSTIAFIWNKTEAAYIWVNTYPAVKEYFEVGRALWNVLCAKVYDLCWTVDQKIPLCVETIKKKIF